MPVHYSKLSKLNELLEKLKLKDGLKFNQFDFDNRGNEDVPDWKIFHKERADFYFCLKELNSQHIDVDY